MLNPSVFLFHRIVAGLLCMVSVASGVRAAHPALAAEVGMRLGLQAWTYRELSFLATVERTAALGVTNLQAYPGQCFDAEGGPVFDHKMSESLREEALTHLRAHDVTLVSYGVVRGKNEAEWRRIFAFAQAMGMSEVVVEPPPEILPFLAELARESGLRVSLHNHPPPTRWADPTVALDAIKPFADVMGLCADTGHWVRSNLSASDVLGQVAGYINSVHFKDISERGVRSARDRPWGEGVSDATGQLAELQRQQFDGVVYLEYEHQSSLLDEELASCVAFFNRFGFPLD